MHISLTSKLEQQIKAKVESGLYNASEVIREALRFMITHEEWIREVKMDRLREQLTSASAQMERGEGLEIKTKASLDLLFDET